MGGLRICRYQTAERPFFLKRISVNIYTMEELCYYIYHNFALIDDTLMNEELFQWIETQIGQPRLAGILRQNVAGGASYRKLASLLLDITDYCSKEQLHSLFTNMDVKNTKPGSQMLKSIGDRLLENHKYAKAIREYNSILHLRTRDPQTNEFLGSVYHNMGVAYARLFLYDQAVKCFAAAYEKNSDPRSREQYLAAVKMGGEPIDTLVGEDEADVGAKLDALVKEASEDETAKRLRKLQQLREEGNTEAYENELQAFLQEQKKICAKYISV